MSIWTHINSGSASAGSGSSTVVFTPGWPFTPGNLVIASLIQFNGALAGVTIGDGHNSYSLRASKINGSPSVLSWTAPVVTGGALPVTANVTTPAFLGLLVGEFQCSETIGSVESVVSAAGATATPSPGAIAPSATDLIYCAYASNGELGSLTTVSSPFAVGSQVDAAGAVDGASAFALDQTAGQTPIFTKNGTAAWAAVAFAITSIAPAGNTFPPTRQPAGSCRYFRGLFRPRMRARL